MDLKHYAQHVRFFNSVEASATDAREIGNDIDAICKGVEDVGTSAGNLAEQASRTLADYRVYRKTLQYHSKLLEILELPQLLETCIHHKQYNDALQVAGSALKIWKAYSLRYGSSASDARGGEAAGQRGKAIVDGIAREVAKSLTLMEAQHLQRELSSDIELPECLTAIATIQKARSIRFALVANVRPEEGATPMQLFFLECRSRYLRQQLQATQRKYSRPAMLSSKEEALDIIEVHRHFFSKTTAMYKALFSEAMEEAETEAGEHLSKWLTENMARFLHFLRKTAGDIDDMALLRNMLEQCLYMNRSLERIGIGMVDVFRYIVETRVVQLFGEWMRSIGQDFQALLNAYDLDAVARIGSSSSIVLQPFDPDAIHPPQQLVSFPPLAQLLNSMIAALNELRNCALKSIAGNISASIKAFLENVIGPAILAMKPLVKDNLSKTVAKAAVSDDRGDIVDLDQNDGNEKFTTLSSSPALKLFQKFQEAHEQLVVPFVWKAFEKVMQG
eukprot:g720.t1